MNKLRCRERARANSEKSKVPEISQVWG